MLLSRINGIDSRLEKYIPWLKALSIALDQICVNSDSILRWLGAHRL